LERKVKSSEHESILDKKDRGGGRTRGGGNLWEKIITEGLQCVRKRNYRGKRQRGGGGHEGESAMKRRGDREWQNENPVQMKGRSWGNSPILRKKKEAKQIGKSIRGGGRMKLNDVRWRKGKR